MGVPAEVWALLRSKDRAEVRRGLDRLVAEGTAAAWEELAEGCALGRTGRPKAGRLAAEVPGAWQGLVALYALHYAGRLEGAEELSLGGEKWVQDLDLFARKPLPGLRSLNLSRCAKLADVAGLAGLPGLRSLNLNECRALRGAGAASPVGRLVGLEQLTWQKGRFEELDVSALEALETLDLRECTRLRVLRWGSHPRLRSLCLTFCAELSDFSGLAGMHALETLDLACCDKFQDISPVLSLQRLQSLDLTSSYAIRDINGLERLPMLRRLMVGGSERLEELSGLSRLGDLQYLKICHPSVNVVDELRGLAGLEELNLRDYEFTDLGFLAALSRLRVLTISAQRLTDIRPMAALEGLEELWLSCRSLTDLTPLSNLRHLRRLRLYGAWKLQEVGPLAGLVALEELDLSFSDVCEVDALASLFNLRKLNLSYTPIQSVDALAALPALEVLDLSGCRSLGSTAALERPGLQVIR